MKRKTAKTQSQRGFALIVTLSLMILLTVIAVGLLSLSAISLRTSSQGEAMAAARANARLAMILALGELQMTAGLDQNVTAPASSVIKNSKQPHLTGAWNSWHWTPSMAGSPKYSDKKARFNRWLVSSADPKTVTNFSFASSAPPAVTDPKVAKLVGDFTDSQGISTLTVAEKVSVASTSRPGKLAWAVFDESTKAALDLGDPATALAGGDEIASRSAPNRYRADILDATLSPLKTPDKLYTLGTAALTVGQGNAAQLRKRFHDFTTGSTGLLTDTANGGLRKDLTTIFESTKLPKDLIDAPNSVTPYPAAFTTTDGALTWAYIRDHYRKYKNVTATGADIRYNLDSTTARNTDLLVTKNGIQTGLKPAPEIERLLPVIAKMQLVFSVVSHYAFDVSGRRQFLDANGDPKLYTNYGVVNLVCDPVITLYNPYDVALDLTKTRIRVWDPPVGFRFTKIDNKAGTTALFRAADPTGAGATDKEGFAGLAQFQQANQKNPDARKCYTLVLADGNGDGLTTSLKLMPGEVKVFSPRVPSTWTWSDETSGGYGGTAKRTFFDYAQSFNFGNVDHRNLAGIGKFGLECAPGWDQRAGMQTDHLATDGFQGAPPRNPASRYPFEVAANRNDGFVTIRTTDEVMVEAKPLVRSGKATTQFQVDVMAGLNVANSTSGINVSTDTSNLEEIGDTLRSYRFNFTGLDPKDELSKDPSDPIIERQFEIGAILQPDTGTMTGKKKAFAMLEMSSRTTKSETTDSKPWLYNNIVVEGGVQQTGTVGLTHQSYDLRLIEMANLDDIAVDPDTKRGYFGAGSTLNDGGSSFVNMLRVPVAPASSLGDLIPTNMIGGSLLPRVVHPFGNSRAHPLIPSGGVSKSLENLMMDHSYLLNDALWDSCYFSGLTEYAGGVLPARTMTDVLKGVFGGSKPGINSRVIPASNPGDPVALAGKVAALGDADRSKQLAKYIAVSGSFNVNSTSVDAWRAALSSLRDREVNGLEVGGGPQLNTLSNKTYPVTGETPFIRAGKPIAGANPQGYLHWAGFRTLTDPQIESLAKSIVTEITNRGVEDSAPFMTLGEFVNRRIGAPDKLHTLAGLLQTAIDKSAINDSSKTNDGKTLSASSIPDKRKTGVATSEVLDGSSAEGAPSMITQGDLMAGLASIATVRGDTFKIRSYGESLAADGTTVLARAWCETIVQRMPDFVNPADAPETALPSLGSNVNKTFGRRFNVISFRWLAENEI